MRYSSDQDSTRPVHQAELKSRLKQELVFCDETPSPPPPPPPCPEERIHMQTILATEGVSLNHACSPKIFFEALTHAMIGGLNLLNLGWLHRDVSAGNVLMTIRPEPVGSEIQGAFGLKHMSGFMIDGDLAAQWRVPRNGPPLPRSGTLPFISRRCHRTWDVPQATALQTGLDDLESFVWVWVWFFFQHGQRRGFLSDAEARRAKEYLSASDPITMHSCKASIWPELQQKSLHSKAMNAFSPALIVWLKTIDHAVLEMGDLLERAYGDSSLQDEATFDEMSRICSNAYTTCIEAGLVLITALPDSWDALDP